MSLPYSPVYDPWTWLVWGREVAHLGLDTSGGPSWKPLPVAITAVLSPLGEAAPGGWLAVARFGWLLAPVLAAWLALRIAAGAAPGAGWGGRAAAAGAALAAASVALTADDFTPASRQFAGGLGEPLLVSLVLGAVAAELERRRRLALALGFLAALLRPEAWPFLLAYGYWAGEGDRGLRGPAIALAVAVPLLWLVPDLVASGSALTGADVARGDPDSPLGGALDVLARALAAPLAAAWVAALGLCHWSWTRGERLPAVLLGGAAAWIVMVAAMAAAGFAGLPRFVAPATATVSVLGGAGLALLLAAPPVDRRLLAAGAAVAVLAAAGAAIRIAEVPGDLAEARRYDRSLTALFDLIEGSDRDRLLRCGGRVSSYELLAEPPIAWKLDIPLSRVGLRRRPFGVAFASRGEGWAVLRRPCQAAASSASGRVIAGVSGAAR